MNPKARIMFSITEVSITLGISAHPLRYYEKEKIIDPNRDENGVRYYSDEDLKWLRFVMKLKQTQMPLAKIREYSRLFIEGERTVDARLKLLEDHRKAIQDQIETLTSTEEMLSYKINAYKAFIEKN
jgi:DNA-binding transcriptional MerR regulator